jgi:rare lipoprotein A
VLGALLTNNSYASSRVHEGLYGGTLIRASYYCSGYRTASGEHFNPNGFTAAHRTLPFGTRLAVTNPANGRTVVVRINDRGPFVRGVSLDLARGAAFALGMRGTGTVRIARLGSAAEGDWQSETFAPRQTAWSQEIKGPNDATRFWGSPFGHALD